MPSIVVDIDVSKLRRGTQEAASSLDIVSVRMRNVEREAKKAGDGFKSLSDSANTATTNVKSLAAQIVGLVGVYKTLQQATSFISRGIDFNASIEASQISIASVLAATNKITTAQGVELQGQEKFNAALEKSGRMMEEIQVLALKTTANFDQLADGVAGIIAPASKFGVEMEKLPKFAVNAAQAMTTMKIPVQQMRTEIEAVLSGNINKSQDILATNLGITKEMVKEWQTQGVLVDKLNEKFEMFDIAGEKVADSWNGLKNNMEDALNFISGKAGEGLFKSAQESYKKLIDLMIQSEGSVGVSKDFENVLNLIKEVEDAIGQELVNATNELIDKIKELNKPENIKQFKDDLVAAYSTLKNVVSAVYQASSAVVSFIAESAQAWNSLPDYIRELGFIGGFIFGKKGLAVLASAGIGINFVKTLVALADENIDSDTKMKLIMSGSQKETNQIFSNIPGYGGSIDVGSSGDTKINVPQQPNRSGSVSGSDNTYTSNIPDTGDNKKKTKTEAERFAERVEKYSYDLEKMRNKITELRKTIDPTLSDYDKLTAKINAEADAAVKNADVKARETVARKQATQAQAEEMAELEKEGINIERNQKLKEAAIEYSQKQAQLLSNIASETGNVSLGIESQNKLIELQADAWRRANPELSTYINEYERLAKMKISRNPLDGMKVATQEYFNNATNWSENFGNVWTSTMDGMADGLAQFVRGGELQFDKLLDSFINMVIQMQMRAAVSGLFGAIMGAFGNTGGVSSAASAVTRVAGGIKMANGGAFQGLSAYSNSIVTRPTLFTYGNRIDKFANGAGLMGEAGAEAIMPLTRMSNGRLGVESSGGDMPPVNITVVNQTGGQSTAEVQSQQRNDQGGMDVRVLIKSVVASDIAAGNGGIIAQSIQSTYGVRRQVRGV